MNTETGEILNEEQYLKLRELPPLHNIKQYRAVTDEHLPESVRKELATTGRSKIGRNDPCPCGSGKKFKKCCYTGRDKP